MIWNWKWKKMLLSISSKYSYFKLVFNYIKKGLWKGILICWFCDTLVCFRPPYTSFVCIESLFEMVYYIGIPCPNLLSCLNPLGGCLQHFVPIQWKVVDLGCWLAPTSTSLIRSHTKQHQEFNKWMTFFYEHKIHKNFTS
jgi:hypothetical protein